MIIKRYIANTMNEAVAKIRYELGKDAVIISQRKMRKKGIKGLFYPKVIEVTAAVQEIKSEVNTFEKKSMKSEDFVKDSIEAIKNAIKVHQSNDKQMQQKQFLLEQQENVPKESPSENSYENDLIKEIKDVKSMLNGVLNSSDKIKENNNIYKILKQYDLEENIIEEIINKVNLEEEQLEEKEKVRRVLVPMVQAAEVNDRGVIVLVGPTGVGKTTTIAKLAGRFALIEKKKVGLITVDTYRIGAVEQLKTYADIMDIPFKVIFSIKDMETAVEGMKDCDIVLVDTTGRSSKNKMQISELRAFIDKTDSKDIHLVISCTTKNSDIKSIVEGYKVLNYNNVIITKLDETTTYGSILNILKEAKKPLSYVSIGQNVPDDIKTLNAEEVVNIITGVESIC